VPRETQYRKDFAYKNEILKGVMVKGKKRADLNTYFRRNIRLPPIAGIAPERSGDSIKKMQLYKVINSSLFV
jgi:hypothetical protein